MLSTSYKYVNGCNPCGQYAPVCSSQLHCSAVCQMHALGTFVPRVPHIVKFMMYSYKMCVKGRSATLTLICHAEVR